MCKTDLIASGMGTQAVETASATTVEAVAAPQAATAVEAPCPACGGLVGYSSSARRVYCPVCGWEVTLLPDEARDFTNAISGIDPDLNLDLFLQLIAGRAPGDTLRVRWQSFTLAVYCRYWMLRLKATRTVLGVRRQYAVYCFAAHWVRRYLKAGVRYYLRGAR